MGTVAKGAIAREVASETGLSIDAAKTAIDTFLACVSGHAEQGDTIRLTGFGSFNVRARPARQGRNPRTGEAITVPETRKLHFKASKAAEAE